MKWLYRKSRWIHKYIGLFIILFAIWMSFSGILMNHPELISGISMPKWMTLEQYKPDNWNRSSIIEAEFSQFDPDTGYFGGKLGIWKTDDGGFNFSSMMEGMPSSDYYRKTYTLFLQEDYNRLLAGTEKGLFVCDTREQIWKEIILPDSHSPVRKIISTSGDIIVFTESRAFRSPLRLNALVFEEMELRKRIADDDISLVRLFFDFHSGKVWGLPGQLLFDLAGIVIIFLSVSAFFIWFNPRKKERKARKKTSTGFFIKYHNNIGIIFGVILIFISFTSIFMRPPLLAVIADGKVPAVVYPAFEKPGVWDKKIRNALWSKETAQIIIADDDGFWVGSDDFSSEFVEHEVKATVFVMGATVFENYHNGTTLIGSFSGLFEEHKNGEVVDLITGEISKKKSRVRPADIMVTGYFRDNSGREFLTAHEQGLIAVNGTKAAGRYQMPEAVTDSYRQPLWNFLFELHNGRIFRDFIGDFYLLLVPIGSILFFLIIFTGIIDWFFFRARK